MIFTLILGTKLYEHRSAVKAEQLLLKKVKASKGE